MIDRVKYTLATRWKLLALIVLFLGATFWLIVKFPPTKDGVADSAAVAAWVQGVGTVIAVLAAAWIARDQFDWQQRAERVRRDEDAREIAMLQGEVKRISLEHWAGLLTRSSAVIKDAQARCGTSGVGSPYFRSSRANLQVLFDLMRGRDMNVLRTYDELKQVSSGMAAVHSATAHLDDLIATCDRDLSSRARFLAAVDDVPEQLEICVSRLRGLTDPDRQEGAASG